MKPLGMVVVLAVLAGCGGTAADSGEARAKKAFLAQAEAICAKANSERKALVTPTALAQLTPYVMRVVAIADEATTHLKALALPARDRAELQAKVLGPLGAQLAAGHAFAVKVAAANRAGNQAELARLLADPPTQTRADLRWMKRYGFDACVKAADTSG